MRLIYTEDPVFQDQIHQEDLRYMLENTYTDTSFFLQALTHDNTTYTFWGDVRKNIYFISDSMRERFGFERNRVPDLLKEWFERIYNPIDKSRYSKEIEQVLTEPEHLHNMRYQVIDKEGKIFWIHAFGEMKWNEDKTEPLFFCGKVTEQDNSLITDPVSTFAGESILINHLKMLDEYHLSSTCIGFCLNDIDKINSVQGRTYGDRLIRDIATELVSACPPQMPFYRLDGMRFMAVLSDSIHQPAAPYIERIRRIIDRHYREMGMPVQNSCAFAVMRYPKEDFTILDFLGNMVTLLRLSRDESENGYLDETSEAVLKMQQQTNMEMLLSRNVLEGMTDFRPVVQPVVSTKTGKIIGGETLLRWKYDDVDVSPAIFIPILEKNALIQIAGRWIFEQSVQICKRVIQSMPDFYLTVNVSLKQLYDPAFLEFIPAVLKKYDLDGHHIVVEMTESCLDQEPEKVEELFKVCKSCDIRIALDDFGTGYSSMRVLLKYPLSIVKIDRTLLLEMSESQEKYNFISSIVFACHQFGKTVCIEGVENEKQRDLSQYAGCDMIQGFFYHRPTEIDRLYQVIEEEAKSL